MKSPLKNTEYWKQSKGDELWFYRGKQKGRGGTTIATETLNAVKVGTEYDIYLTKGNSSNWKKLKRVKSREEAIKYMRSHMRKH